MACLVGLLVLLEHAFIGDTGERMEHTLSAHVRPLAKLNNMQAQASRLRSLEIDLPNHAQDVFGAAARLDVFLRERASFAANLDAAIVTSLQRQPTLADSLDRHWRAYNKHVEELVAALNAGRPDVARALTANRTAPHFEAVFQTLRQLAEATERDAEATVAENLQTHRLHGAWLTGGSLLGLILIVAWQLAFARTLRRKLSDLDNAARGLSEGHQTAIEPVGNDELTDLSQRFNLMQERVLIREQALAESERRFRDLAESASDWFWETDAAHTLTYLSERFAAVTERPLQQAIGRRFDKIGPALSEPAEVPSPLFDAMRRRTNFRELQIEVDSGAGKTTPIALSGCPIFNAKGEFAGYRGTGTDIAPRLTAQAEVLRAEKLTALATQIAGVAHEVNTPLGASLTIASSMEDEHRKFLKTVESGSLRRSELDRLLAHNGEGLAAMNSSLRRAASLIGSFKQVAVDQASDQRRQFELASHLDETLLSLSPLFKRTRHSIVIDCPPELHLDSYPGALSQVITNLITNSLTHGFDGLESGSIEIQVSRDEGHILLRYRDNGHGIAPAVAERLYEPFFTTRRGRGGSGLGMHIVRHLVIDRLGGGIELRSSPGAGVEFTLRLPHTANG